MLLFCWSKKEEEMTCTLKIHYRFLMLTSMFVTAQAAANTLNRPIVMVMGLRIPSQKEYS